MEKVTGIGGMFFRATKPELLADWYAQHLGIRKTGESYEEGFWWQDEGPTRLCPSCRLNRTLWQVTTLMDA